MAVACCVITKTSKMGKGPNISYCLAMASGEGGHLGNRCTKGNLQTYVFFKSSEKPGVSIYRDKVRDPGTLEEGRGKPDPAKLPHRSPSTFWDPVLMPTALRLKHA